MHDLLGSSIAQGFIGGAFLGIASVARMALGGRITAATSVPAGVMRGKACEAERWLFLGGLLGSGLLLKSCCPSVLVQAEMPVWREVIGGLLAGVGVAFVHGRCPSGHGIRGNNALSLASTVYTMAVLALAAALASASHVASAMRVANLGSEMLPRDALIAIAAQLLLAHLGAYTLLMACARTNVLTRERARDLQSLVDGSFFGCGIGLSGLVSPARVAHFFDLTCTSFDPTVGIVMLSAALITTPAMKMERFRSKVASPALAPKPVDVPAKGPLDGTLMTGGALFSAGWGIAGRFPGAAIVGLASPAAPAKYLAAVFAGVKLADTVLPAVHDNARPCAGAAGAKR
ncbi:hypothetical protein KFE25_013752 [Diacronema lutheri]|uniref:Sulphur transport domain-containing protein n=1 Tax=Diacronema lutheri TaxID=2081491 RepID=A0A8J6CDK1_DIALT|nr:hypothetical protein KFE25_013752 [Diacronema lutheri]